MSFFIASIVCLFTMMHPVHVSFTNVEYQQKQNEISVSFQVFTDDFELLFYHLYEEVLDLSESDNINQYNEKIDRYFNQHFTIKSEKRNYHLINNDYKTTEEFTWFYYRIQLNDDIPEKIKIKDTVLFDLFLDQKNLLIFKWGTIEKGHQFDLRNKEISITLQ